MNRIVLKMRCKGSVSKDATNQLSLYFSVFAIAIGAY